MKWHQSNVKENGGVSLPNQWVFLHYYEAYNALFRVENALRLLVYIVLKEKHGDKWLTVNTTSDDNAETTIGKIAKQRMNQTQRFGYLGYVVPCPLMYLTSGELSKLITSDAYWRLFTPYIQGSKDIISNKLDELNSVRNALAHFRPIKADDLDVIKHNARHILTKVESSLVDIMKCSNVVPTNTNEHWYSELRSLGTELCTLSFNQSNDEKWIKLSFNYPCPVIKSEGGNSHRRLRVLSLNTPAILNHYPTLQARTIIVFEEADYGYVVRTGGEVKFSKTVHLITSRATLEEHYAMLKIDIEGMLLQVLEETSLIMNDNLARGKLIQAVDVMADQRETYWIYKISQLNQAVSATTSPEYWGQYISPDDDFITSTGRYPWMPVDISEGDIPF